MCSTEGYLLFEYYPYVIYTRQLDIKLTITKFEYKHNFLNKLDFFLIRMLYKRGPNRK